MQEIALRVKPSRALQWSTCRGTFLGEIDPILYEDPPPEQDSGPKDAPP